MRKIWMWSWPNVKRIVRNTGWRPRSRLRMGLAFLWRRLLFGTTVIAIAGSNGKTTAKLCLAHILSRRGRTKTTDHGFTLRHTLPQVLLHTAPWHRFLVVEVGIDRPGTMKQWARLLAPDMAAVTTVDAEHSDNLRSLEITAAEKAQLLRRVRRRGAVILNGDDPRVAAMARPERFQCDLFGTTRDRDVWADEIDFTWPKRLRLRVHAGHETEIVQTRLVGRHWVPSILTAIALARRCGVSLRESAEALGDYEPYTARMQPVSMSNGATMLRDEFNGSFVTLRSALAVLREVEAERKLVIFSDFTDGPEDPRERFAAVAKELAQVADAAVFVGEFSSLAREAALAAGMPREDVHAIRDVRAASEFVRRELRTGDVALLKGRNRDHLSRIYLSGLGAVDCWLEKCALMTLCDHCPHLQGARHGA